MKTVQYFDDDYLQQCKKMSADNIAQFLESFRLMNAPADKMKLISIKIPESLLVVFRQKCQLNDLKYQTQIKILMKNWIE